MKPLLGLGLISILVSGAWIIFPSDVPLRRIGAVETVTETATGLQFRARIDTGAESCSIHSEAIEVVNPALKPADNVGKQIRFLVRNKRNQAEWLTSEIAEYAIVRTSERKDGRYKVYLTLRCDDVERHVLVTLNDRESMRYSLLIGRNFLHDEFVVDVGLGERE